MYQGRYKQNEVQLPIFFQHKKLCLLTQEQRTHKLDALNKCIEQLSTLGNILNPQIINYSEILQGIQKITRILVEP